MAVRVLVLVSMSKITPRDYSIYALAQWPAGGDIDVQLILIYSFLYILDIRVLAKKRLDRVAIVAILVISIYIFR